MSSVISAAFFFVLTLGVLITFHEFGHFWVARRLGVKVLRFSVGFGRPLWRKHHGPDNTEYVIAALPLGGYVKMLDEREGEVHPSELPRAFNRQPLASRAAIVAAGPVFNFVLAILVYWAVFMLGVSGLKPLLGEVVAGSPAALAGFQQDEEILSVGGRQTPTWNAVVLALLDAGLGETSVTVEVRAEREQSVARTLEVGQLAQELSQGNVLELLGIRPARVRLPPVIGQIEAGGPASRAGLESGDLIVRADGTPIDDWGAWVDYVRSKPDRDISLQVERGGQTVELVVRPASVAAKDGVYGRIGAAAQEQPEVLEKFTVVQQYGPFAAMAEALAKTWDVTVLTLKLMLKMIVGDVSLNNLSGPLSIAQYAGGSASIGLVPFLTFLAIVSVSLGVLNLLPIPVLDGGHLLYYAIEFIKGSPVSPQVEMLGQRIGVAIILVMMIFAFYNDLVRIFG